MNPRMLVFASLLLGGCHVVLGIEEGEPLECDGGECAGAGGNVSGGSGGTSASGGSGGSGGAPTGGVGGSGAGGATGGSGGAGAVGGTGATGGVGAVGGIGGTGGAAGGAGGAPGGTGGGGGSGGSGTGGTCSADTLTPGFYCSTTASCNAGCPIIAPEKDSPCSTPMTCAYCTNLGSFYYIAQCNGTQWCAASVEASPC